MTNDELADYFKAGFDELDAKLDALADGVIKRKAQRMTDAAHTALDAVRELFVVDGTISPMSGGGDKP